MKQNRANGKTVIQATWVNYKWFTSKDFKGQDRIPHNPRNNRKTKKGGKR